MESKNPVCRVVSERKRESSGRTMSISDTQKYDRTRMKVHASTTPKGLPSVLHDTLSDYCQVAGSVIGWVTNDLRDGCRPIKLQLLASAPFTLALNSASTPIPIAHLLPAAVRLVAYTQLELLT